MNKKIKVTKCNAAGEHFANLTEGSIHDVIPAPVNYATSLIHGVWVKGALGDPVKLLRREYVFINEEKGSSNE